MKITAARRLNGSMMLTTLAVLIVVGCDRVVQFEPSPDEILPTGSEVLAEATSTLSGSGTEYRSVYWLVGLADVDDPQTAIDMVVEQLRGSGFETLDAAAHNWASVSLTGNKSGYIAIGTLTEFLDKNTELGPQSLASFEESASDRAGSTIVILLAPT